MANPDLEPLFGPVGDKPAASVITNGWTDGITPKGPEHTYLWHQLYAAANKSANDGIWGWEDPATSNREYNTGSIIRYSGVLWESTADGNTGVPGVGTDWRPLLPKTGAKNLIINGDKAIQQRGTTGGTAQVIDAENVKLGGTYTVSFTGTATVRAYDATSLASTDAGTTWTELTSGASASGTTVTVTAGRHIKVEFSTTDFNYVQFEPGSVPTNFEQKNYTVRLTECQRYFIKEDGIAISASSSDSGGRAVGDLCLPTIMRTTPSVENVSFGAFNYYNSGGDTSAVAYGAATVTNRILTFISGRLTGNSNEVNYLQSLTYTADAEHFTDIYYEDRWF